MPDIAALVTPPLLLDSTGAPANGDIYTRVTSSIEVSGGYVTPTQGHGVISFGQFKALDGSSFDLPVTPEGVAVEIFVELREEGPSGRKKHRISRTVAVPDQSTVTWLELVDVIPVGSGTDYEVPAWVLSLLDDAIAAGAVASDARDDAVAAQIAAESAKADAEAAAASVPSEASIDAAIADATADLATTASVATKLDATAAGVLFTPFGGDASRITFKAKEAKTITTFAAGHGWYVGSGAGAGTNLNEAGINPFAAQGVKMVTTGVSGSTRYISTPTPAGLPAVIPTTHQVRVWVKYDGPDKLFQLRLFLSESETFTNYYDITYVMSSSGVPVEAYPWKYGEVVPVTFDLADAVVVGTTPNVANLKHLRVAMNDRSVVATVNILKVDLVPKVALPVVCVSYDDSGSGIHTYAARDCATWGIRAELFPIIDRLDQPGFLTSAQLRELHDIHGWRVSAHATTYARHSATLPGLSAEVVEEELRELQAWHQANGYESFLYAYPSGRFTAANAALVARFFPAARMAARFSSESRPPNLSHRIQTYNGASNSVAAVKAAIDKAVANGGTFSLMFHNIEASPADSNQITPANHKEIIDYLGGLAAAGSLIIRPLSDELRAQAF